MTLSIQDRIDHYNKTMPFPSSLFVSGDGRLVGTWIMGNNYQVKSNYYGGYPHGYLKRIKALFPDKRSVLHLFSGKVNTSEMPGDRVDINPDVNPDLLCDAHELSKHVTKDYDLVMVDPPYSVEDCEHYGTIMIKRNVVLRECSVILKPGAHVVWLDQVLPMYKKTDLKTVGYIGMVKSTNHRFRVVTIFEKQ